MEVEERLRKLTTAKGNCMNTKKTLRQSRTRDRRDVRIGKTGVKPVTSAEKIVLRVKGSNRS